MKLRLELEKATRDANLMGMIVDNYEKEINRKKLSIIAQPESSVKKHDTNKTPRASVSHGGSTLGFRQSLSAN